MSRCENCIFGSLGTETHYCKHLLITGKSRLKDAYKRLGVNRVTEEVRNMLDPINCKFFVYGTPMRDEEAHRIEQVSSDEERARASELRRRAWAAEKKDRERERILNTQKRTVHRPERSWNVKKALELYKKGCNDPEIARQVGTTANSIWYWRKQEGLPAIVADRIDDERETLYRRGLSDEEIAEKIGTSWRAVAKWRYRRHLPVNSKASIQRMKRSELRKKMQRLYDKGLNDDEIGKTLGISPKQVASWRGHNHLLAQHTKERMARDGLL